MFDQCIILFFFVQLAKMSARSKELEAEVRKDFSNLDWSRTMFEALFSALRIFW